jgi:hypothetical protein
MPAMRSRRSRWWGVLQPTRPAEARQAITRALLARWKFLPVNVFLVALAVSPLYAAPTTYVHPSYPSCGGFSPCYRWIQDAVQNTDTNGTVVVLANTADNVFASYAKTGITIRGYTPAVTITGGVNVTSSVMNGWTIRDLIFTDGVIVSNLATSLTLDNISAAGVQIGYFTQDTNAAITIHNCGFPSNQTAQIAIIGSPGYSLRGTVTIAGSTNINAINIVTYVAPLAAANIDAAITIEGNQIVNGVNIIVNSDGSVGTGSVTGAVRFLNNTASPTTGVLGIIVNGNASGSISGPVTFTGNVCNALVVGTYDSVVGGSIGPVTATGNDVEAIEINDKGAPLGGPILLSGNRITSKGGGAATNPYIQVDGQPISGGVTIENTTGDAAFLSTTSWGTGDYSGTVRMTGNAARRMVIDSRAGSITAPFTVSGNTLRSGVSPDSTLTIRTLAGGDLVSGTISDNALDGIQLDIAGGISGPVTLNGNRIGQEASLIAHGTPGAGTALVEGNDIAGIAYFQGMTTTARFNRIKGVMNVVAGATVDARLNWWGCNSGPGASPCSSLSAGIPYAPWLVFEAFTRCSSATDAVQTVQLLQASDNATPGGNVTPATASVTSTEGMVNPEDPVIVGSGTSVVDLPSGATAVITSRLDNVSLAWQATCDPDITSPALYNPADSAFYLRNRNAPSIADLTVVFGMPGAVPLMGDWDGDGVTTPGLYVPATGQFFLKNSLMPGTADIIFSFGPAGAGWLPIVGDWNGDGIDSVGLFAPASSQFFLRNSNTSGYADITVAFGPGGAGWLPVVGDWNGNGIDTVGLYMPAASQFFLRTSNSPGYADIVVGFGPAGAGWLPIAGDWNGDGTDTIGLYAPASSQFFLRNTNTSGFADLAFAFGPPAAGWQPLTGDFDGP